MILEVLLFIIKSITVQNYCTTDQNFGSYGSSFLFYFLRFESLFVLFLSHLFQIILISWLVLLCFRWKSDYKKWLDLLCLIFYNNRCVPLFPLPHDNKDLFCCFVGNYYWYCNHKSTDKCLVSNKCVNNKYEISRVKIRDNIETILDVELKIENLDIFKDRNYESYFEFLDIFVIFIHNDCKR